MRQLRDGTGSAISCAFIFQGPRLNIHSEKLRFVQVQRTTVWRKAAPAKIGSMHLALYTSRHATSFCPRLCTCCMCAFCGGHYSCHITLYAAKTQSKPRENQPTALCGSSGSSTIGTLRPVPTFLRLCSALERAEEHEVTDNGLGPPGEYTHKPFAVSGQGRTRSPPVSRCSDGIQAWNKRHN